MGTGQQHTGHEHLLALKSYLKNHMKHNFANSKANHMILLLLTVTPKHHALVS